MRICFVSRGTLDAFKKEYENGALDGAEFKNADGADLILLGFGGKSEVRYEEELKGETHFFEDAALLSKKAKAVVVCGCITDARGHRRKSAIVAEGGRVKGVSDMLNVIDGEVGGGAALRVYDTKAGRMGVMVADDLYFPETVKALALCGSEFIVCPFAKTEGIHGVLLRAYAYAYGLPLFFCGDGYAMIADPAGDIAFASPQGLICTQFQSVGKYHLVQTRRRGAFSPSE